MKVFFLENDPNAFAVIDFIRNEGHEVFHAQNLKDAAFYLEYEPCAEAFSFMFFDVGLPPEEVRYFVQKRTQVYACKNGFNGLLFLLDNMGLLEKLTERIAIVTAFTQQLKDLKEIELQGNSFLCENLSEEEDIKRSAMEQVTKMRFTNNSSGKSYTLSFIDKGGRNVIKNIVKFMNRG